MIISLWSGPRNCSTALMYSMAQRDDMAVRDEPLFGHFLASTGAARPSREETMAQWPTTSEGALAWCKPADDGPQHLFLKHMGNHIAGLPMDAFSGHHHVILTRHPDAVMKSYSAHVNEPTMEDLCYLNQLAWAEQCIEAGWPLYVIESDALLENPREVLEKFCAWLGLAWDERMMQWKPGARPEDGPWAKYWYERVHRSTGWEPRPPKIHPVAIQMQELRDEALKLYQTLLSING